MKYRQLVKAIDSASQQLLGRAAAAVNQALVIRNWLIGASIVEFEQHGEDRAKYGARLLEMLARDLKASGLAGMGISILERSRRFYLLYPEFRTAIPQSVVAELEKGRSAGRPAIPYTASTELSLVNSGSSGMPYTPYTESAVTVRRREKGGPAIGPSSVRTIPALSPQALLQFSWSQWSELIRLDDPLKRAFYENECLKGNWSVRQLQRQIGSLLFERTGLSKNKAAVVARARKQASQQNIEDLIRDHYVLEFTGLGARPEYTESDLETALLNHCSDKDHTKVQFATVGLDNKLFVSRYRTVLPSAGQLQRFVEADRDRVEAAMKQGGRTRSRKPKRGGNRFVGWPLVVAITTFSDFSVSAFQLFLS